MPQLNDRGSAERVLRIRMAQAMLSGTSSIDIRTALRLQLSGVIRPNEDRDGEARAQNAMRAAHTRAPLLLCEGAGSQREAVSTEDLLGSPDADTRTWALDAILALPGMAMLATTRTALVEARAGLTRSSAWERSAVVAMKALRTDWCYRLATLRQCVAIGFDQAVPSLAAKAMRPTMEMLALLGRSVFEGERVIEWADRCLGDIVEGASSSMAALEAYMELLGHLPLGGRLTATTLLRRVSEVHGFPIPSFADLYEWASAHHSPLAQYHACRVAAETPGLVEAREAERFWGAVLSVVQWWAEESDSEVRNRWELRSRLTAHFTRYGECSSPFPVTNDDFYALALWQAEHLARVFVDSEEVAWAVDQLAAMGMHQSSWLWSLGRPTSARSALRFAALNPRLLWGRALLAAVEQNLEALHFGAASESQKKVATDIVMAAFVTGFPLQDSASGLFDLGALPRNLLTRLATEAPEERRTGLRGIETLADAIVSPEDLLRSLSKSASDAEDPQLQYLAFRVRMLAFLGELPEEAIGEVLSDADWRMSVLARGSSGVVEPVFEAVCESVTHGAGRWKVRLPHLLAETLEGVSADAGPRAVVFGLLVLSCVATETTSALERVLAGPQAVLFRDEIHKWRRELRASQAIAPGWITGRLRATLAALWAD